MIDCDSGQFEHMEHTMQQVGCPEDVESSIRDGVTLSAHLGQPPTKDVARLADDGFGGGIFAAVMASPGGVVAAVQVSMGTLKRR